MVVGMREVKKKIFMWVGFLQPIHVDLWAFLPLVLQNPNKREREMGWLSTYTMKEGKSNKILRISIDIIMELLGVCALVSKNRRFSLLVRIKPELGMIFITRILELRLEVPL